MESTDMQSNAKASFVAQINVRIQYFELFISSKSLKRIYTLFSEIFSESKQKHILLLKIPSMSFCMKRLIKAWDYVFNYISSALIQFSLQN